MSIVRNYSSSDESAVTRIHPRILIKLINLYEENKYKERKLTGDEIVGLVNLKNIIGQFEILAGYVALGTSQREIIKHTFECMKVRKLENEEIDYLEISLLEDLLHLIRNKTEEWRQAQVYADPENGMRMLSIIDQNIKNMEGFLAIRELWELTDHEKFVEKIAKEIIECYKKMKNCVIDKKISSYPSGLLSFGTFSTKKDEPAKNQNSSVLKNEVYASPIIMNFKI